MFSVVSLQKYAPVECSAGARDAIAAMRTELRKTISSPAPGTVTVVDFKEMSSSSSLSLERDGGCLAEAKRALIALYAGLLRQSTYMLLSNNIYVLLLLYMFSVVSLQKYAPVECSAGARDAIAAMRIL
ncbi:hypothetical protein J6590_037532 [Homalodisca vitripennis]|nr:hypothetical protein J6590_037532 [Homalodisca vitripennis]